MLYFYFSVLYNEPCDFLHLQGEETKIIKIKIMDKGEQKKWVEFLE